MSGADLCWNVAVYAGRSPRREVNLNVDYHVAAERDLRVCAG